MVLRYHRNFKKSYKKLTFKLQRAADERLLKFLRNPFDESLRNHALHGKYEHCRSMNVTGDYRIVYSNEPDGVILLIDIGTHPQLYG